MRMTWLAVPLLAMAASARDTIAFTPGSPIRPESRLWITGTSNLRRFTCQVRQLSGTLTLRANATRRSVLSGENASSLPSLSVPVDQLDCGRRAMNRHLRDALHSATHPTIEFRLASYEVDLTPPTPTAHVVGQVTIGGVRRPVAVTTSVRADSLGALHVQGTYVVRMTDFGLEPPRRFGGLLRVRDRIVVHFDVAPSADGGAVDGIRCSLIPPVTREPKPGETHAAHS